MKRKVTKGPKIALCLACRGTGLAEVPAGARLLFSWRKGKTAPAVCPQCGGSGRVTVSAEMELDIRPYQPKED